MSSCGLIHFSQHCFHFSKHFHRDYHQLRCCILDNLVHRLKSPPVQCWWPEVIWSQIWTVVELDNMFYQKKSRHRNLLSHLIILSLTFTQYEISFYYQVSLQKSICLCMYTKISSNWLLSIVSLGYDTDDWL